MSGPATSSGADPPRVWSNDRLEQAIGEIVGAARGAGRLTGIFAPTAAVGRQRLDEGYDLVIVASDLAFLAEGAAAASLVTAHVQAR